MKEKKTEDKEKIKESIVEEKEEEKKEVKEDIGQEKEKIKEELKSKENKSSEKDIKKKDQSINNENSSINTQNNQDTRKKIIKEEKTEEVSKETKKEIKNEGVIKKVFIIIIIAVIALLIFILVKDFFNVGEITFQYHNLTFSKTRFGDGGLTQYKTIIGFRADGKLINHEITIRNHPKDLEKIPANITGTVLKNTYVSFQKSLVEECSGDVQLAGFRLGYDLFGALKKLLPEIDLGSGLFDLDENATEKEKVKLKNCLDASDQTMIFLFEQGDENRIYPDIEYENCYHVETKDCESVLPVSERLLIVILDKLRGYEE